MRRLTAGVVVLAIAAVAAVALAASPLPVLRKQRVSVAHWLVAHHHVATGAFVYAGAAAAGDPVAKNNLGVLHYRGIGGPVERVEATQLFAEAAALGSAQAETNLAVAEGGGCSLDPARSAATVRRLAAPLARGNPTAAGQTIDCLYLEATKDRSAIR